MATVPFAYLIKFIPTGQVYYGVRYCNGCLPDDLWKSYFTSSKYVKDLIVKFGKESFLFEVRRTFLKASDALRWGRTVLRRMKIYNDDRFINKNAGGLINYSSRRWVNDGITAFFIESHKVKEYLDAGFKKGRIFSSEHQSKINKGVAKFRADNPGIFKGEGKGRKASAETKEKLKLARSKRTDKIFYSEESRKRMSENRQS